MNTLYFTKGLGARLMAAVALFSLVAGMVPTQAFAATNLFDNSFEASAGTFTANGWTVSPSDSNLDWHITQGSGHLSNTKAQVYDQGNSDDTISKALSTAGKTGIVLSYYKRAGASLEAGDHVYVEWYNGTSWVLLTDHAGLQTGGWTNSTFNLPVSADNLASFAFRFRANGLEDNNGNGDHDEFQLDAVTLTYAGLVPPPVDVCSNIDGAQATIPQGHYAEGGQCFPNPVDVCPNIDGAQASVPEGKMINEAGNCVDIPPPPVDVCDNLEGNQESVPQGYVQNGDNCDPVTPPTDVCPNIDGAQATVPEGKMINEAGNCVDIPPPPVDVCDNLEGNQESVPQGYVQNGDNCDLIPPPPVDVCSNIDGAQATVPQGYHLEGDSMCVQDEVVPDPIYGCTDESAVNWNSRANTDDKSCIYDYVSQCITETPNLLANGSFEESVGLGNNAWGIFTNVPSWTYSLSSGIEVWQNLLITPSLGIQNVELDGEDATKITQTVATIPGATYELRFDFAARSSDAPDNHIEAAIDGVPLVNQSTGYTNWVTYGGTFTADASTDVSFVDLGTPQAGTAGTGTLLDNAVLCLVREPVVDYCPNIKGNQTADEGYTKDVNGQCYRPIDSCEISVVSDTTNLEGDAAALPVAAHPAWVQTITGSLAQWIWGSAVDTPISPDVDETQTFTKTFVWSGTPATAILEIASDNGYSVKLNGTAVGNDAGEYNYSSTDTIVDLTDNLIQGVNTLEISVTNKANGATSLNIETGNPAGLIYDLTITNTTGECGDDGDNEEDTYRIFGYVWHDNNKNEEWDDREDEDGGEAPLSGWTVRITNGEESYETETDANGRYYFDVPAGTWTITEDMKTSWRHTTEESHTVTVPSVEETEETIIENILSLIIPTAYAALSLTEYGEYNFGNDRRSSGGGGGGTRVDDDRDGEVLGDSDTREPLVLGEQTSVVPTGAPNTGKGGLGLVVMGQFLATPRRRNV